MKYYLSETWMGYEVVREDHGHKEYLASVRNGRYKWVLDYTYAAKYRKQTALKHLRECHTKAISIIEPYASLIAEGHKLIETRSWKTNYRGRVYIHASASAIPREYRDLLPMVESVKPGHIIAAADLVDCVLMTDEWIQTVSEGERCVGFYSPGRYGWILDNVEPVEPFKAKGHLGLWEVQA